VGVVDAVTNNIERYMDLLSARQKLVVSNMANIDTPGYKSKDIDFQFEFISLSSGSARQEFSPNVIDTPGLVIKSDGNNVSLDRETRLLAETALRFNVASNLMRAQLKIVESAIKEGQSG
jgi:flagellar basal-body rod protein FlgB